MVFPDFAFTVLAIAVFSVVIGALIHRAHRRGPRPR